MSQKQLCYKLLNKLSSQKYFKTIVFFYLLLIFAGGSFIYLTQVLLNSTAVPKLKSKFWLIDTPGCQIPITTPFNRSILEYIKNSSKIVCTKNNPPLVEANLTSIYVVKESIPHYLDNEETLRCCYKAFFRREPEQYELDVQFTISDKCIPFVNSARIREEFIIVNCEANNSIHVYEDFFAFVAVKEEIKNNIKFNKDKNLNILIFGIDAVSRMNLYRQMPLTTSFLKQKSAIDFSGYNKIGDNSFPNIMPMLCGLSGDEVKVKYNVIGQRCDNVPLIWREYKALGYVTSLAEDTFYLSTFYYDGINGFKKQPTDYSWGYFNFLADSIIGNSHTMNIKQCLGSRTSYELLLNYTRNFVITMEKERFPYFLFHWETSLSHDYLNDPKLGDENHYKFIKYLYEKNYLNNTVLILLSDHGMRGGGILKTVQGQLELKLPFLIMLFPEWYLNKYQYAHKRLLDNTKRLTTHYDFHETLIDLLHPFNLSENVLKRRFKKKARGYSFFDDIPIDRTCSDADIPDKFCTCNK